MNTDFLKKYVETPSPVGFEMLLGGQKVWIEEAKKYAAEVCTDNY
jgi:putative aminopeptidase FrvX